ncbi:hypothetical protein Q0Z83_020530 [Actinoplanes sichuanensis]|uniref:DUF6069 family protein n=1 Tax=Actinoplanes sichuanensis TaxID=512349 RepID=A0ABW4AIY6_9ACTN|nr:DUF6069 family protein [Actinoplanes sichuanensis]BEL03862.1 hypothetical protein Q0Z83_020530 [Actinoplanes sichuanensis]
MTNKSLNTSSTSASASPPVVSSGASASSPVVFSGASASSPVISSGAAASSPVASSDFPATSAGRSLRRAARRGGRAATVAIAAASALLLWAVDSWGDIALTVRQGESIQQIGPVAVVTAALVAGAAAWALLAVLERTVRRPARIYRIIASVVLLVSLAGPLSGTDLGTRLALLGMHLTVGAALILGLPGRRCR